MKKSNKTTLFYVISSLSLLFTLTVCGTYGVYVSVGLSFVKNTMPVGEGVPAGNASNVAIGGTVNFEYSMVGIIILSIALIVLAIFDFVSLIRQIILFKQFKAVKNSSFEKQVETKIKSKGVVIFFAILLDLISIALGILGIFLIPRSLADSSRAWLFYILDALIVLFALSSMVFLIIKLRAVNKYKEEQPKHVVDNKQKLENSSRSTINNNIDEFEYKLLKLKHLKSSKIISDEEYQKLRKGVFKENDFDVDEHIVESKEQI